MRAACALFLAVALPVPFIAACAETPQGPLAGASDAWARAPEPTSSSSAAVEPAGVRWPEYDDVLHLPLATSAPFAARGHLPEQIVELRLNDAARAPFTALVTDTVFPDGSLLAELSHDATGNGYVMRKNADGWSYFELDARGNLLASGAPALCVGCHNQAPADQVFGLPRAP